MNGTLNSVCTGQQMSSTDMIAKFNLSSAKNHSVKWLHAGNTSTKVTHDKEENEFQDAVDDQSSHLYKACWVSMVYNGIRHGSILKRFEHTISIIH
eukprot:14385754-Ditylum_brightwellii.AAC.1